MEKIAKPVIYIKNKLIKMYSGMTHKGVAVLYLYQHPKNFSKNMDEAEQAVAKQKSKKSRNINLIFFLVNIGILAALLIWQFSQEEDMSIGALLNSTFSPAILVFAVAMWFLTQVIDSYRINLLVKRSSGRSRPFLSFKTNAIGRYYDAITPMSTGGQPFQVFYMKNRGINVAAAISVPMGKYVINQLCLSVIWTICLIASLINTSGLTTVLCVVGWVINSFLMAAIIVLSINQRVGTKIVVGVMKLLQKMHLIKDYEKSYNQVIKVVTDFQSTLKNFLKDGWLFFKLIFTNIISMFIAYSMAFFVYCIMIGWFDFSVFWDMFLLSVMIDMAASFIPLPGGTGVSELSFTALFAGVAAATGASIMVPWALLIWRILTYYIILLQGILVMAYDNVIGNRKYLWLKKKWELEAESISFEQDKLHEFTTVQKSEGGKRKKRNAGQIF